MKEEIAKYGKQAKGQKELLDHLDGKKLTLRQMIKGVCYDCMGYYADGKVDCEMPLCCLYPVMPYRKGEKYKMKAARILSPEQRTEIGERLKLSKKRIAEEKK